MLRKGKHVLLCQDTCSYMSSLINVCEMARMSWYYRKSIKIITDVNMTSLIIVAVQLAITVLKVLVHQLDVRMEHTKMLRHRMCVKSVLLGISVTTPCLLLSLTTQQQFAPWDIIVPKERGITRNTHVQLEHSTTEQVRKLFCWF